MKHFLEAVAEHRTVAREALLAEGYHHKVVYAKAEKAARKGYTDFGVVADRPWLTDKGREFLSQ
jgi:predicted esterase